MVIGACTYLKLWTHVIEHMKLDRKIPSCLNRVMYLLNRVVKNKTRSIPEVPSPIRYVTVFLLKFCIVIRAQ